MADEKSDAEVMYGQDEDQKPAPGTARIELHYLPILHRGHAFLRLVKPDGTEEELHGLSMSRHTGQITSMGMDGAQLIGHHQMDRYLKEPTTKIGTVANGSADEIARIWERGKRAAQAITNDKKTFDYKAHDPTYEFGGNGGEIQNSNSVAYTLGKAMNLDLDSVIKRAGIERKFSGWGRDLLDAKYRRYVAPPQFAVTDTP